MEDVPTVKDTLYKTYDEKWPYVDDLYFELSKDVVAYKKC